MCWKQRISLDDNYSRLGGSICFHPRVVSRAQAGIRLARGPVPASDRPGRRGIENWKRRHARVLQVSGNTPHCCQIRQMFTELGYPATAGTDRSAGAGHSTVRFDGAAGVAGTTTAVRLSCLEDGTRGALFTLVRPAVY